MANEEDVCQYCENHICNSCMLRDSLEKRNAELVRDINALDGCWEKRVGFAAVTDKLGHFWRNLEK